MSSYNPGYEEVPKYCYKCGKELSEKTIHLRFSKYSGENISGTVLYCPIFLPELFGHFYKKYDENGYEINDYGY